MSEKMGVDEKNVQSGYYDSEVMQKRMNDLMEDNACSFICAMNCYHKMGLGKKGAYLECGMGTGVQSLQGANALLADGGLFVISDYSEGFVDQAADRFRKSTFCEIPRHAFEVAKNTGDKHNVEDLNKGDHTKKVVAIHADMTDLPFADNQFDGVCAPGSVFIVKDPAKAMCELSRVTKPGGRVTFTINCPMDWFLSRWGAAWEESRQFGFKVENMVTCYWLDNLEEFDNVMKNAKLSKYRQTIMNEYQPLLSMLVFYSVSAEYPNPEDHAKNYAKVRECFLKHHNQDIEDYIPYRQTYFEAWKDAE